MFSQSLSDESLVSPKRSRTQKLRTEPQTSSLTKSKFETPWWANSDDDLTNTDVNQSQWLKSKKDAQVHTYKGNIAQIFGSQR